MGLYAATLLAGICPASGLAQTRTADHGWSSVQSGGSAFGDPVKGERVAKATCAACHGTDGNSADPQYPKLSGQNPAYLYGQLWAFKRGTRKSDVMSGIVATLSDADIANAAAFFSRQRRNADKVKDGELAAAGQRLFFSGMPACAMCHGSGGGRGSSMMGRGMMGGGMMGGGMMGMMGPGMADVPNLDGQHARYLIDQLSRFASGERQGRVMNQIAPALDEMDREAVAEFLSGAR
jgi:cytochrome c553